MAEYEHRVRVGLLEVILQELIAAQQTGILTVQRSKAGVRDVGTITLLHGEPVGAHAGDRLGNDAIDWLYTWGRCQCEFLPQAPAEIVISPPPPVPVVADTPASPLAFLSRLRLGRSNEINEADEAGGLHDFAAIQESSFTPVAYKQDGPTQKVSTSLTPRPAPPSPPARITQADSNIIFSEWLRNGGQGQQSQPALQAPYRLWQGQDALLFLERSHASRLHRHVFLLLDGQRTTADIVRITGRSFAEISQLLDDLEQLGIIKQEHNSQARW
ncbi:MAG: hypothetical protein NVS2B12_20280 [Ktedonobacteraceae bacterium]